MSESRHIKRALISVSDKTNLLSLATALKQHGVEILSTGGTAKFLQDNHLDVTLVSDYTGFPEILGGRVKTLHPKIHAGLLAKPKIDDLDLTELNIDRIDLVVANLYPFEKVTANVDCDLATAIENIDIGGPTMIRAAAKNHSAVTVVVNPDDYALLTDQLKAGDACVPYALRFELAKKAFAHTARYDAIITNYLNTDEFPDTINLQGQKSLALRYGENPHQHAAFYKVGPETTGTISSAKQLQGKELSYNNIADADAALECVKAFDQQTPACVIVKHANPCGVALGKDLLQAYQNAFDCDKTSAFGGIIAFNQKLDIATAKQILQNQFVEVVVAPSIDESALNVFNKKPNVRVLSCGPWQTNAKSNPTVKAVAGGLLLQQNDDIPFNNNALKTVTKTKPSDKQLKNLIFAWHVAKFVKSNAIVYADDLKTLGIGAGQMSRIDSSRIAALKAKQAGFDLTGAVMASDAFFPFSDSIDMAEEYGVTAIIQPGGSMRDEEVIAAANEANIAMVFTGIRHFRH